tara:strand:- start:5566 stop:6570 length:1005 start_codon:yes stop_codon:yes gene_type:complete
VSEGLGEWDPRVLPNRLKELIDEIIYSVAVQDNSKAIRAITDMFSDVRNPKLICIDSGIKKVEKKVKGSFGIVDAFVMAMALGSGGKYIRADDINDYWAHPAPFLVRGLGKQKIIKECIARGKDFYFMDTGYVGNNPSTNNPNGKKIYHRIVKNALQNLHMPEKEGNENLYGGERWKRLAIPFKDNVPGRKILIVPPSEKVMKYFERDLDQWINETILEIKKHTSRPIEVRKKPSREDRVSVNTIEQALDDNVHCMVTFNSIAALEAMIYGKPAIVLGPNCAQDLCEKRLERIEFVKHPGRKQLTWLCRYLSNNQFTYDEMLSGYAWQQLGAGK